MWESNPRLLLGRKELYHLTNTAWRGLQVVKLRHYLNVVAFYSKINPSWSTEMGVTPPLALLVLCTINTFCSLDEKIGRDSDTNTPNGCRALYTISRSWEIETTISLSQWKAQPFSLCLRLVGILRLELSYLGLQPSTYPYMLYPHGVGRAPRQVCVPLTD